MNNFKISKSYGHFAIYIIFFVVNNELIINIGIYYLNAEYM